MTAHVTDRLDGTVALVTGGGRGIGRSVALVLASAGASVAVLARSPEQVEDTVGEVRLRGAAAAGLVADVTDRAAVEAGVREAEERLGPLTLVVNNAGRLASAGPLWEADPDEWWRDVEVDLRGPLLCCRAVLPGMVARGAGRVVYVGSGAGLRPGPWISAYAVAKAALARLTDSLEAPLAGTGVHAFLVAPGLVRTGLTRFPAARCARLPPSVEPGQQRRGRAPPGPGRPDQRDHLSRVTRSPVRCRSCKPSDCRCTWR